MNCVSETMMTRIQGVGVRDARNSGGVLTEIDGNGDILCTLWRRYGAIHTGVAKNDVNNTVSIWCESHRTLKTTQLFYSKLPHTI